MLISCFYQKQEKVERAVEIAYVKFRFFHKNQPIDELPPKGMRDRTSNSGRSNESKLPGRTAEERLPVRTPVTGSAMVRFQLEERNEHEPALLKARVRQTSGFSADRNHSSIKAEYRCRSSSDRIFFLRIRPSRDSLAWIPASSRSARYRAITPSPPD